MTSDFRNILEELLELIRKYHKELQLLNQDKKQRQTKKVKEYKGDFIKLKALFLVIQKVLADNQKPDACEASVSLISPLRKVFLPKIKIILQVKFKEKCDWQDKDVTLEFGDVNKGEILITRTISVPKKQLTFTEDGLTGTVSFDLAFENDEKNVVINYLDKYFSIQYIKYDALKLGSPADAEKTKNNFNPFFAKKDFQKQIKEAFPLAEIIPNEKTEWKTAFDPKSIQNDLEKTPLIELPEHLEKLSEEELKAKKKQLDGRKSQLERINRALKEALQRYEGLELNYEGENKTSIFDDTYHEIITEAQNTIEAISNRIEALSKLLAEIKQKAIVAASEFLTLASKTSAKFRGFWDEISEIKTRFETYPDLILSYEEWKKELDEMAQKILLLKEAPIKDWTILDADDIKRTTEKEKEEYKEIP